MDRTYVFNSDGNGGGGSRIDINSLLPGMMGRGIDPAYLALMNGNGGFGGQNGIWGVIYLAIVASIFGWNNGGFGGFGRGNGLPAELAGNEGRELLMSAIQGNGNAINQIASTLNCSTQQVQSALANIQNSVGLTGTQIINAIQSGNSGIVNQLSTCCCNILQSIERQGAATQLQACQNMNALTNAMTTFRVNCVEGIEINADNGRAYAQSSPSISAALNHYIGYEHAADIAAEAVHTGRTVREVAGERTDLPAEQLDEILDPIRLARGLGQTCREHQE